MTTKYHRWLANLLIVGFLAAALVETLPVPGKAWQRARDGIDFVLDITGLWQGNWHLFSPEVDRQNHHIEVHARYADGSEANWRSPDWQAMSCVAIFRHVREIEFYDRIRGNHNQAAWPAFANYARRSLIPPAPGDPSGPVIELIEVSQQVPAPGTDGQPSPSARRVFFRHPSPR